LPIVFVSLGLGSVIASAVQTAPWLIAVGRHKTAVFTAVGVLLAFNYWLAIVRPHRLDCAPRTVCYVDSPAMRLNRVMFWSSVVIWAGGVAVAYAALWWSRLQP
jgi:hypothetical protein